MKAETKHELILLSAIYVWVGIVSAAGHIFEIPNTWVYCLVVPLYFLLAGDDKEKTKSIFFGSVVGLTATYLMILTIGKLTPVLGGFWGFFIPLMVTIALLMFLNIPFPHFFNNVGFTYLIIATIDSAKFVKAYPLVVAEVLVGGFIYLYGVKLIAKLIKK